MRVGFVVAALAAIGLGLMSSSAGACDAKAEVEAAFLKQLQRVKGWRSESHSRGASGFDQTEIFDFLPPDRMYRKVIGAETLESIGIGKWAWSNLGGTGWSELQPQMAQMAVARLRMAFTPAKAPDDTSCLGKVAFEGKDYFAYQTKPEKTDEGVVLARTIYVDEATGLPAFNVIGAPDRSGEPLVKLSYSYPDDISIEKP